MRISTIIPAYNCEPYLRRAVESLLATHYDNQEIVIIDDGSRDGTLNLANQLQLEHLGIVCVLTHPGGTNRGVSASRNLGLEATTGEYVGFLDGDDYVLPNRFATSVAILNQHPEVDGVYELCHTIFEEPELAQGWWDDHLFGFREPVEPDRLVFALLAGRGWASSAILIRRSLQRRVGGFLKELRIAEDFNFWFRLACAGTLVAGDLQKPVSVYWRRANSAYQPRPEHRLAMIASMTYFECWMRIHLPNDSRIPQIHRVIIEYIIHGVQICRENKFRTLAWSIMLFASRYYPSVLLERRLLGQLSRMIIGR